MMRAHGTPWKNTVHRTHLQLPPSVMSQIMMKICDARMPKDLLKIPMYLSSKKTACPFDKAAF